MKQSLHHRDQVSFRMVKFQSELEKHSFHVGTHIVAEVSQSFDLLSHLFELHKLHRHCHNHVFSHLLLLILHLLGRLLLLVNRIGLKLRLNLLTLVISELDNVLQVLEISFRTGIGLALVLSQRYQHQGVSDMFLHLKAFSHQFVLIKTCA